MRLVTPLKLRAITEDKLAHDDDPGSHLEDSRAELRTSNSMLLESQRSLKDAPPSERRSNSHRASSSSQPSSYRATSPSNGDNPTSETKVRRQVALFEAVGSLAARERSTSVSTMSDMLEKTPTRGMGATLFDRDGQGGGILHAVPVRKAGLPTIADNGVSDARSRDEPIMTLEAARGMTPSSANDGDSMATNFPSASSMARTPSAPSVASGPSSSSVGHEELEQLRARLAQAHREIEAERQAKEKATRAARIAAKAELRKELEAMSELQLRDVRAIRAACMVVHAHKILECELACILLAAPLKIWYYLLAATC